MENWVIWILWISILLIPFLISVLGFVFWFKTPKQNKIFGYRTKKTLSCENTWGLANKLWGKLALLCGIISLVVLSITLYFTLPNKYLIGLIISGIVILALIAVPIIGVEVKIRKDILKPIPLYYSESEIIIVRQFKENITISYKDIKKATYTNIYSTLKIYTEDKTYRFKYIEGIKDLLKLLKQKVKDVDF